ncbi:MAG: hypothetical protein Q8L76_04295 [Cypionkella sp.]|nr:hypothetical protein [Cypionkella sp.]
MASGRDLAQACRDAFPRFISIPLWLAAEIAIIAKLGRGGLGLRRGCGSGLDPRRRPKCRARRDGPDRHIGNRGGGSVAGSTRVAQNLAASGQASATGARP